MCLCCGLLPGGQEGREGAGTFCGVISSVPNSCNVTWAFQSMFLWLNEAQVG